MLFARDAGQARNWIELLVNRLKQFRVVAARHDRLATHFAAMVTIACILFWV